MSAHDQETPPPDYVPAPWVKQFSKVQLQWLAEQLHHRQQEARRDAQEARNQATLTLTRLNVLEALRTAPTDSKNTMKETAA